MKAQPVALATITMSWIHPTHGRVNELLCDDHEQAVLSALKVLGIGCIGERSTAGLDCTRCVAADLGVPPRRYVAAVGEPR